MDKHVCVFVIILTFLYQQSREMKQVSVYI